MLRRLTLRNALAAITMAVVALWGGGKAPVERAGSSIATAEHAAALLRSATLSTKAEVTARVYVDEASAAGADRVALATTLSFECVCGDHDSAQLTSQQAVPFSLHTRPPPRAPPLTV